MNLLEHYIKEVHSVKACEESWTYDELFKDDEFVNVDLTYNCYGAIERRIRCWSKDDWEHIQEQGYFMA